MVGIIQYWVILLQSTVLKEETRAPHIVPTQKLIDMTTNMETEVTKTQHVFQSCGGEVSCSKDFLAPVESSSDWGSLRNLGSLADSAMYEKLILLVCLRRRVGEMGTLS